ncbi:MAG: RES family NAD+ phosphorylase [Alphaproteobacteria bacterium]
MEALSSLNLAEYFQPYENNIYRIVEGQHFIATRKLVDSDEEQRILEELLDQSKPTTSTCNSRGELHYLLYTPFRYPPLKSGARFHTIIEQSLFYGSEELTTSMAEVVYGRFLFAHHSAAQFKPMQVPYTHFVARVKSNQSLLLNAPPFENHRNDISHPSSYAQAQLLGSAMRQAGTELFTYYSARHIGGVNVGLFSPEAFQSNKPIAGREAHWSVYVSANTIEFKSAHLSKHEKKSYIFHRENFYIDQQFPVAA